MEPVTKTCASLMVQGYSRLLISSTVIVLAAAQSEGRTIHQHFNTPRSKGAAMELLNEVPQGIVMLSASCQP